jgi:hypothetical protein
VLAQLEAQLQVLMVLMEATQYFLQLLLLAVERVDQTIKMDHLAQREAEAEDRELQANLAEQEPLIKVLQVVTTFHKQAKVRQAEAVELEQLEMLVLQMLLATAELELQFQFQDRL